MKERILYLVCLICLSGPPMVWGQVDEGFHVFTNKAGQKIDATIRSVSMETGRRDDYSSRWQTV